MNEVILCLSRLISWKSMLLPHSNIKNTVQALKNISLGRNRLQDFKNMFERQDFFFHSDADIKHSGTSLSKY